MSGKLGEILIRQNLLTPDQLKEAVEYQRRNNLGLTASLVHLGAVSEQQITSALSKQYGVPSIDFSTVEIDELVTRLVPREVAQKYCVVPVSRRGATLTLAMADPANVYAMDDIKFVTGFTIEPVVASEVSVRQAIERGYGGVRALDLHTGKEVFSPLEKAAAESQLNRPLQRKKEKAEPVRSEGLSSNDLASAANLVSEFESEFGDAEEALEVLEEQSEIDIRSLEGSSQEAPRCAIGQCHLGGIVAARGFRYSY